MSLWLLYTAVGLWGMLASYISSVVGLAGGALLLAVLSLVLSPAEAILVHAAVQSVLGISRAWIFRDAIEWTLAIPITFASFIAVLVVGRLALGLSPDVFALLVAMLLLYSALKQLGTRSRTKNEIEKTALAPRSFLGMSMGGFAAGALGTLAGSSGPVISLLLLRMGREGIAHVANKAFIQLFTHGTKVLVLASLLNRSTNHAGLITLWGVLVVTGLLGTILGKKTGENVPLTWIRILTGGALLLAAISIVVSVSRDS